MNLRRMPEAISAADEAAAARPTDVVFLQRLGAVFARRGEFVAAARYYKSAFDLRPEIPIAERYLDALLSQNPPAVRLAEDLINSLGQRVLSSPGLLSGSVAINARRSRLAEAERDATAAFDLVSGSPDGLVVWHRSMSRAFLERDAYMAYLRRLAEATRATVLRDGPVVFLATVQVDRPETVQAGMELLNRLANGGEPREVRILALRTIGTTLYGRGEYSQAAQVWEASLRMFPDDWEINNNLAYTLAEHLDRGADAVPYALVAVRGQPQSPSVNDTVGWAYFKAGEPEKALPYLTLAARLSRDASELAATCGTSSRSRLARATRPTRAAAGGVQTSDRRKPVAGPLGRSAGRRTRGQDRHAPVAGTTEKNSNGAVRRRTHPPEQVPGSRPGVRCGRV